MSRPQKPHLSFITTSFPPSPTKNPKYPSPSSSPDLPPTSFPRLSLPTPLETITFATSSLKRKSRPTRSITRPADETDRVELGIVTLDVFTALRTNPSILDVFTASRKDSSPIVKVTKKRKGTPVKEKGKVIEKPKLKKAAETPSRYSKRHEAEKPKTEVSWVYDIELAEEEPEEEEGMEMVRDLEAMGKGEFAREIFQRVKALRKSSAKHVGDESPKTRVKSLAAAAAAVGAKMKKEEENVRGRGIQSKLPPANPMEGDEMEEDEATRKRSRSQSLPSLKKEKKRSKKDTALMDPATSSLAALEAAGKAAADAVHLDLVRRGSEISMSSEDSVMSFYGDDMDVMSPTTDVLSTLSSLSSMSSSITDATIAAGDLVSLSQAFSGKKSGSMPPTSAPRSTANSSRATSNPPSHAKSSTYSAVSASPSSPISTSTKKKTISNPAPKTRAAPTKASKPLPDFLGGGRRIKDRDGNFVEVQMNLFSQCDEDTPPMVWKGTPLTIPSTVPRYAECNGEEIETCATLRMMPAQYLEIKETLLATIVVRGPYKKRDAQGWFRIDVNKTNKLYDWFYACGWIRVATQEWERREQDRPPSSPNTALKNSSPSDKNRLTSESSSESSDDEPQNDSGRDESSSPGPQSHKEEIEESPTIIIEDPPTATLPQPSKPIFPITLPTPSSSSAGTTPSSIHLSPRFPIAPMLPNPFKSSQDFWSTNPYHARVSSADMEYRNHSRVSSSDMEYRHLPLPFTYHQRRYPAYVTPFQGYQLPLPTPSVTYPLHGYQRGVYAPTLPVRMFKRKEGEEETEGGHGHAAAAAEPGA